MRFHDMLDRSAACSDYSWMRISGFVVAGTLVTGFVAICGAQQPSVPPSRVETVIVTANERGPAIWHAGKDGAEVEILGVVEPLPDNFIWNTKPLAAILGGVHRVLLPPEVRMGIFSGAWFYLTESNLLHPPDGKSLWDVLDPHIAADLARICGFLHEPKDRYSGNSPILAAMRLGSDFRHVDYLTTHEPEDEIAALARSKHITAHRIATYDLVSSAEDLLKLPPTVTGKCVEAEISDIDYQSRHVTAAANAWAIGDTAGMMANWSPSNYFTCLIQLSPHATSIDDRSVEDTVSAINDALAHGGDALAVVNINALLRKDGVIDRLKAAGVSISGP